MNLEEVQFNRLIKGCIVKIKHPVDVQCQLLDISLFSKSKDWEKTFSLSPGEYYKVFAIGMSGSHPIIYLDIVQDYGYLQPWVYPKFLTLDDECMKYNEEVFKNREWEARIAEKIGNSKEGDNIE